MRGRGVPRDRDPEGRPEQNLGTPPGKKIVTCVLPSEPRKRLVDVKKDTKENAKPEETETLDNNSIDKNVDVTNLLTLPIL